MSLQLFGADEVIEQVNISPSCNTYFVKFDINDKGDPIYPYNNLTSLLFDAIHEFAFGLHEGLVTDNTKTFRKIKEAAKLIYKIKSFNDVKDIYTEEGFIADEVDDSVLRRGEFGELILHLILRDFHKTIPLLSKIYFKDSLGITVHGFDAIHVEPETKTLWLGESKLYIDGRRGIKALVEDIKTHIKTDFLESEFLLISKKVGLCQHAEQKDYWEKFLTKRFSLKDTIEQINIPLLLTYTGNLYLKHLDKTDQFIEDLKTEVEKLQEYFNSINDHPLKSKLNIILLIFPVKCKKKLVKRLHHNLSILQSLNEDDD